MNRYFTPFHPDRNGPKISTKTRPKGSCDVIDIMSPSFYRVDTFVFWQISQVRKTCLIRFWKPLKKQNPRIANICFFPTWPKWWWTLTINSNIWQNGTHTSHWSDKIVLTTEKHTVKQTKMFKRRRIALPTVK